MNLGEIDEALTAAPLLASVRARHRRSLARETKEVSFYEGQRVVREGIAGSSLYVVLAGEARVERGGRRLATLGPGDHFGEISLLDPGPRSASVIAETDLRCLKLNGREVRRVLERDPSLTMRLLAELAARVRGQERPLVC